MDYQERQDPFVPALGKGVMQEVHKDQVQAHSQDPDRVFDALATLSSMILHPDKNNIDLIETEIRDQHAYYFHVDEELDSKSWYHDIKRFLEIREYPESATNAQKRALIRLANHFFLNGEVLYRRTPDLGLLRYVDAAEATRLLEEINTGTCGPHMNDFTLAKKIL
ncbi:uncharacterized protein [Nicotiana tomentosiformis]|uniref:uncharacterized protein n=1 Tax=Nicotiana tomentosiformis TaxID=4098 RepID=UPI00051BB83C|nr:uncharacterized protein LOC104104447 [Nicotiana tomentosiformis]